MSGRGTKLRLENGVERGAPFEFTLDGAPIQAFPGETVAATLAAHGLLICRRTIKRGHPRGLYCGMGVCWECVMVVNGRPNVRTCMTLAAPGMRVETQQGRGPGAQP